MKSNVAHHHSPHEPLPVVPQSPPPKRPFWTENKKKYAWWALWSAVIIILYMSVGWIMAKAFFFFQLNPDVWAAYKYVEYEISSRSFLGLFYGSAIGTTFLITVPGELAFLYYLSLSYPAVKVILITAAGILLGTLFNYFAGWLIGPKFIKWLAKEQYGSFHRKAERSGAFLLFFGNIISLFPSDLYTVFLGTIRYNVLKVILWTTLGRLVQLTLLWLMYTYLIQYFGSYFSVVSFDWFWGLIKSGFVG